MRELPGNKILNRLPDSEFASLMQLLEPVSLQPSERLAEPGELAPFLYFPENSIISCQADMQDGKSAEVGMVGKEGVAGLPPLFGPRPTIHSLSVAIAGNALRLPTVVLQQELNRGNGLQETMTRYVFDYMTQVAQRAACAILHRMEQRFALWLLMVSDRLGTNAVETTQERIAHHLGVRRAGITVVAGELQIIGAIAYRRGNLRIINRSLLQKVACECYGALAGHVTE